MAQRGLFNLNQPGQFKWPKPNTSTRSQFMTLLRDPLWQFISVLIGFIGGIILPFIILFAHASVPAPKSIMHVYPQSVSVNAQICSRPLKHVIDIINVGEETLKWTTDMPTATWLTISPNTGSINPQESDSVWLNIDPAGLSDGTYTAMVNITSQEGDFYTITAILVVSLPSGGCQLSLKLR